MTGIHSVCTPAEHGRLRLVAHRHAAFLHAKAALENFEIQPAREGVENLVHVVQHEVVLFHVEFAHVLRQTGGGGLLAREIVGRLLAVTERQSGVEVQVAGLLHHLDKILDRNLTEQFSRTIGLAHVAREQAGIGLAHLGQHLACAVMDNLIRLEALIRFAPA